MAFARLDPVISEALVKDLHALSTTKVVLHTNKRVVLAAASVPYALHVAREIISELNVPKSLITVRKGRQSTRGYIQVML